MILDRQMRLPSELWRWEGDWNIDGSGAVAPDAPGTDGGGWESCTRKPRGMVQAVFVFVFSWHVLCGLPLTVSFISKPQTLHNVGICRGLCRESETTPAGPIPWGLSGKELFVV